MTEFSRFATVDALAGYIRTWSNSGYAAALLLRGYSFDRSLLSVPSILMKSDRVKRSDAFHCHACPEESEGKILTPQG
jgi:hypothetical protein